MSIYSNLLEQIRVSTQGKSSYLDFKKKSEQTQVIKYLWPYIYTILELKLGEIREYYDDIKNGWSYIRDFLPLIFEFPSQYGLLGEKELIESLTASLDINVPTDVMYDFVGTTNFFKYMKEEKYNPVSEFFIKHESLSFFLNDAKDKDIKKIITSYGRSIDGLLELYTEDTFNDIIGVTNIDF